MGGWMMDRWVGGWVGCGVRVGVSDSAAAA